ncbi:tRNA (guanine10-N2)-methyltransferase, partial [Lecanoromycetidae sp. Uapishka_2]
MEFLIRFVQIHETFRRPEIEALAVVEGIHVEFLTYAESSPYSVVRIKNEAAAKALIKRSISSKGIYELWGSGTTYEQLHADLRRRTSSQWDKCQSCTFRFDFDAFSGSRTLAEQKTIIESFKYMGFNGAIKMKNAEQTFTIFEEYVFGDPTLRKVYLGRFVGESSRRILNDYTLKKRDYINTTSMDSELALLTANLSLAGPDKIFYDPFVGTGSFPIACSHFGARTMGSDIDGRMVRGKNGKDIRTSFKQYGLLDKYIDGFISDLTHSPLRQDRWLDGIIGDPPYGVREGLKVLGTKDGSRKEAVFINGEAAHLQDKYIPPKKAYSFEAMLQDLLEFSAQMLVDDGRLSLWMPTANDEDVELGIPSHPALALKACKTQYHHFSLKMLIGYAPKYFEGFKAPTTALPNP